MVSHKVLCCVWTVLLFVTCIVAQCSLDESSTRLLPYVIPTSYQLSYILPNPTSTVIQSSNSASFSGNVTISLLINQTTTCIAFHSVLLHLSSITLHTSSGAISPSSSKYLEDANINIISFSQPLSPQSAQLSISFMGNFNNRSADGFFLSDNVFDPSSLTLERKLEAFEKLSSAKGKPKQSALLSLKAGNPKMYATQFEAVEARRAYPSFDEPEFKATFQLTATVVSDSTATTTNVTVLTNTPVSSVVSGTGYTTWSFQPTPHPMSSYLLAIAVGQLDYIEAKNNAGKPFRIYTPPGASKYATFALNVTTNVVAYFSKIWNLDYFDMLPKMDQISVPAIIEDAMENWGLLTYYPEFLLVDSANPKTPLPSFQIIALVVVHEISHQWFGDTVTTPWWNQIFLNEGYARYLQYIGVDYLFPQWQIFSQGGDNSYYNFAYLPALQADYMGFSSQIINISSTSGIPSIASEAFGIIPYGKGASINRMIAEYVTTDEWNKVMSYHLATHKFTNPSIFDLFKSYDTVLAKPISSRLAPYFFYSGFPVVEITTTNSTAFFTQTPITKNGAYYNQPYWIYIDVIFTDTTSRNSFYIRIEFDTAVYTFDLPFNGTWTAYANPNYYSYALTNYDENSWKQINSKITNLPDYEMQFIIDSQFMLLQMAFVDPLVVSATTRALSVPFMPINDSLPLYEGIFDNWFPISELFRYDGTVYGSLTADLGSALTDIVIRVGLTGQKGEDRSVTSLRGLSLFWGSFYNAEGIVNSLLALFDKGVPLSDEQKKGVYWTVVTYGDYGYESILRLYNNTSPTSRDKSTLLFALTASRNTTQCANTLNIIRQDLKSITDQLNSISDMLKYNVECRALAWNYFTEVATVGFQIYGSSLTDTVINGFDGVFALPSEQQMVANFLTQNSKYFTPTQVSEILTKIGYNTHVLCVLLGLIC